LRGLGKGDWEGTAPDIGEEVVAIPWLYIELEERVFL